MRLSRTWHQKMATGRIITDGIWRTALVIIRFDKTHLEVATLNIAIA